MNEKSFIRIFVAVIIVVGIGVLGFFAFLNKSGTPNINQNQSTSTAQVESSRDGSLAGPTLVYTESFKPYVQIIFQYDVAEYFNVYRANNPNGPWQKIIEKYPGKAKTAVDYELPKDVTILYYRLTTLKNGVEDKISPPNSVEIPKAKTVADWKTYSDDKNGFEFKYPKNFEISGTSTIYQDGGLKISDGKFFYMRAIYKSNILSFKLPRVNRDYEYYFDKDYVLRFKNSDGTIEKQNPIGKTLSGEDIYLVEFTAADGMYHDYNFIIANQNKDYIISFEFDNSTYRYEDGYDDDIIFNVVEEVAKTIKFIS